MKENKIKDKTVMDMEEEIRHIEQFLAIVKQYRKDKSAKGEQIEFLFRGQAADYPLIPKVMRLRPKGNLLQAELAAFKEFKRASPLLVEPFRESDDWDALTLGQHFGLPTRMLDWSDRALTALWFASDYGTTLSAHQDFALVWVLMAHEADFLNEGEIAEGPFEVAETKLYRPRIIKQRINNQSGLFSVHSNHALTHGQCLLEEDNYAQKLLKIIVPKQSFEEIRSDLHIMGVNAFTIFPELEGLTSFLQWKFFE